MVMCCALACKSAAVNVGRYESRVLNVCQYN